MNSFFQSKIDAEQGDSSYSENQNIYFVTFRLADAIPANDLHKLHLARQQWMAVHTKPYNEIEQEDYDVQFNQKIENWLDESHGGCILRRPECNSIVVDALRHLDQEQYQLDFWVIMPNHVHVIFIPQGRNTVDKIVQSWKQYSSNEINRVTGFMGYHLWHYESIDRVVPSEEKLEQYRDYIISDSDKAGKQSYLSTRKAGVLI